MTNKLDSHIAAYSSNFEYAFDNNIILNWYPQRIIKKTNLEHRSLELGLGHGFSTKRFAEYYREHIVIDGSTEVIKQYQRDYPHSKAKIVEGYFETFFTDEKFDIIVMGFVLEHVENPELILKHYQQFLKPSGKLFIAVPNGESLHRRFGHAAGLLPNMLDLGKGDISLGHVRVYSVSSLKDLCENVGLSVTSVEGIFLKPFTTSQLVSLNLSAQILDGMCTVGIDYPELCCAVLLEAELRR